MAQVKTFRTCLYMGRNITGLYTNGLSKNGARIIEQMTIDTMKYTNGLKIANVNRSISQLNPLYEIFLGLTLF